MNGSKLAIYKVSSKGALEEILECNARGYDLLILANIEEDDLVPTPSEGRSILFFDKNYPSGVVSKLAFSFAVERQYETVCGIFDWGSISLEELSKIETPEGVHLIPKLGDEPPISAKLVGAVSKLPMEFLRSFSCKGIFSGTMLSKLPIDQNLSKNYFDTELMFQIRSGNYPVKVDLTRSFPKNDDDLSPTAVQLIKLALTLKLQRLGLFYDPRFDLVVDNNQYEAKFDFISSHSLALGKISTDDKLLILGSGPKVLVEPFSKVANAVVAVDSYIADDLKGLCTAALEADLENVVSYDDIAPNLTYTKVVALDIIEHLRSPEEFLRRIRSSASTAGSRILLTTPNIAFLPIRGMLLLGFFNYGKRGILDRTHTRLFTISSLRRILRQSGFDVEEIRGVPAPIPLAVGRGALGNFLLRLNDLMIKVWPSLFSFQILAVAKALPTVEQLLLETQKLDKRTGQ